MVTRLQTWSSGHFRSLVEGLEPVRRSAADEPGPPDRHSDRNDEQHRAHLDERGPPRSVPIAVSAVLSDAVFSDAVFSGAASPPA
ncbi:hypothetical protein [Humibacillus sp. DSM 29435]|uniref:hypothetical protein n=1 Tax=Humibacillus sp. DSM 29435 TaxID=1869167 RepID=UPI0011130EC6|nr:hypothetical protein [Humibacillus sp. DSM 29435]